MKRAAAVFVNIILVAGSLFAQVHIRETVDINPGFKSTSGFYDDTTHPVYL